MVEEWLDGGLTTVDVVVGGGGNGSGGPCGKDDEGGGTSSSSLSTYSPSTMGIVVPARSHSLKGKRSCA